MANLKDLQEMAKEGKVSEELLKDEEFKSKLKEALKKDFEKEITDEQISEIIKNFEIALQDKELLKEADLENVSGGVNADKVDDEYIKTFIKTMTAAIGALLSGTGGYHIGGNVGTRLNRATSSFGTIGVEHRAGTRIENFGTTYPLGQTFLNKAGKSLGTGAGVLWGAKSGWELGEYLCKKWGIGDKENKK